MPTYAGRGKKKKHGNVDMMFEGTGGLTPLCKVMA